MADYTGTLPAVEVAPLLWALPLLPLAGSLLAARVARLQGESEGGAPWVAPAATWLSLLASLPLAYRLGGLAGEQRALVAPGLGLARVGSIDLHLGLTLDATGALLTVLLLLIASMAQLGLLVTPVAGVRSQTAAALTAAATAAAVFALLASCPLVASIGAGALVLLGAIACGSLGPGSSEGPGVGAALLGDGLLLLGGAIVTWGLSGSWVSGDFALSGRPYFVAIVREDAGLKPGPGLLTLTTGSGSQVFFDSDNKPQGTAPFVRQTVTPGPHTIQVDPGPGSDVGEVRKLRIGEGAEVTMVRASGASETIGAASLLALRDGGAPAVTRGKLSSERWGGVTVGAWAGVLLALGLLLKLTPPRASQEAGPSPALSLLVPQAGGLLVVGLLGARWLPLLGGCAGWPSWLPAVLLAGGAVLALIGLGQAQPGRALGFGAGASAAVGLAASAAGAPEAGALLVALAAVGSALALWALAMLERDPSPPWELASYQGTGPSVVGVVRWLKIAYATLIGLLPVGFGMLEALRALGTARGLLVLPVVALASAALGRLVYALSEGDGPRWEPPRNVRRDETEPRRRSKEETDPAIDALPGQVAPVLAAVALLLGPLGVTVYNAPLGRWLGTSLAGHDVVAPGSIGNFLTLLLVSGAGLLGARWARGRYGEGRAATWADEPATAAAAVAGAGARLRSGLEALGAAVAVAGARLSTALDGAERK